MTDTVEPISDRKILEIEDWFFQGVREWRPGEVPTYKPIRPPTHEKSVVLSMIARIRAQDAEIERLRNVAGQYKRNILDAAQTLDDQYSNCNFQIELQVNSYKKHQAQGLRKAVEIIDDAVKVVEKYGFCKICSPNTTTPEPME